MGIWDSQYEESGNFQTFLIFLRSKGKANTFFHLGKYENSICYCEHYANGGTFSLKAAVSGGRYLLSKQ